MIAAVLLGLGAALALLTIGLRGDREARWIPIGLLVLLVAGAALSSALGTQLTGRVHALFVVLGLVVAAAGGSQVAGVAFEAIDAGSEVEATGSMLSAGQVLRGGAWIGVLERIAVFAALLAHWPSGIAIVLAVKGLGRYPELRSENKSGLAERFIIGTMISVLWAALCAYAAAGPALR